MDGERCPRPVAPPAWRDALSEAAETRRSFVAFEIPAAIRRALAAERAALEKELPRARWVRVENMHLTLRFLGDVPIADLDRLGRELGNRLQTLGPVDVRLGSGGFFPRPDRPRVAWIGGEVEGIEPVVGAVDEACDAIGLEPRDRPWALHLTQARLSRLWRAHAVRTFLDWGERLELDSFQAREVVVFTSDLQRGGAVYTAVERVPLRDR